MDNEDFAGLPEEVFNEMYPMPEEDEIAKPQSIEECIIQICKEHYNPDFKSIAYEIKEYFNL